MKTSQFKDYSELPLFLNAEIIAKVLGILPVSSYELMHESGFPVLKIGNRLVVPKKYRHPFGIRAHHCGAKQLF